MKGGQRGGSEEETNENPQDTLPTEEETTPPTEEEITPPTEEEVTPPTEEETLPPTEEETTPPAEEETLPIEEEMIETFDVTATPATCFTTTEYVANITITDYLIGNEGCTTDVVIPGVIGGKPVTSIGNSAFATNQLTSVTIPNSVTSIGNFAFLGNELTSVTLGTGVTSIGEQAFSSNQLTSVTLGTGVTSIGYQAFSYNDQLTSITIPNGNIQDYAFQGNQLTSVTILSGSIGERAFQGNELTSLTLGTGVTSIGRQAFSYNELTSVTIPNGSIGEQAFSNNQLTSLTLGTGVTTIGDQAFEFNQLTSVTIPSGSIGNGVFRGNKLTSVTLGIGVTRIGNQAFVGNQLTSVTIPDSVTSIGNSAFEGNKLTSLTLGTGVTTIGDRAFNYNQLTSVTIPGSVTSIGSYAFQANKLTSVTLGSGVMSIGNYTFRANQLTSLTIPDSVTSIGEQAFSNNPQVVKGYRATGTTGITVAANANILIRDWTSTTPLSGAVVDKEGDPMKVLIQGQTNIGAQLTGTLIEGTSYAIPVDAEGSFSFELAKTELTDKITLVADSGIAGKRGSDTLVLTIPALDSANQGIPTACFVTNLSAGKITITDYKAGVYPECIAEVVIPESIGENPVTSIGSYAFASKQLTAVTIPDSVTSIGQYAFESNQLTSITIPNSVTSIGNDAFAGNELTSLILGIGVTNIGQYVFLANELTSLTIPDSVTSIGRYAFASNRLISITIPNSVTSIGDGAFQGNRLTSITLGSGVTNIGNNAFYNNQLTSITLGTGVTSIGHKAFGSNQLISVTLPNSVTSIGTYAFSSNQLTSVTLGTGIMSIGGGTFYYNKLTSIVIPDSVKSIGDWAFLWNPGVVKGYRAAGATGIGVASNANIVVRGWDSTTPLTGQVVNKPQDPVMAIVQGETESGAQVKGTLPDETTYTTQADGEGKFALEVPKKDVPDQITLVADSGEGKWRSDPLTLTIPAREEGPTNGNENEETPSKTGQSGGGGTILIKKNPCTEANCDSISLTKGEKGGSDEEDSSPEEVLPLSKGDVTEGQGVYTRAYEKGLTTMSSLEAARFDDAITRAEFAKVISVYATKYLEKIPDSSKTACAEYKDLNTTNAELAGYVVQSCELGLMGYWSNGVVTKEYFSPNGVVTRAEVATILSRLLRGNIYAGEEINWYQEHLSAVKNAGIIQIDIDPKTKELRGNIFTMFQRMDALK
ncbi:MAG: leucine-rich repeat domain-containing protein [Candidatus Absconditabacteria bacterium]|nr:leucine-rich repeat domain-containing protein [Candidatus Absconditabacteria bacterium]